MMKSSSLYEITNKGNFYRLKEVVMTGNAVAFIGAGCSIPLGYPSWSQLIRNMLDKCKREHPSKRNYFEELRRDKDLLFVAEKCKNELGVDYYKLLRTLFGPQEIGNSQEYKLLVQLPFIKFITSNFDPSLEHAFREVKNIQITPFTYSDTMCLAEFVSISSGKKNYIFYIHGRYDKPEEIILSASDYRKHYNVNKLYEKSLENLFSSYPVIFIGSSLADPSFTKILEYIGALFKNYTETHYAIIPYPSETKKSSPEIEADKLKTNYNITAVFYKVMNKHDHTERQKYLKHLLNGYKLSQKIIKKENSILHPPKKVPAKTLRPLIPSIENFKKREELNTLRNHFKKNNVILIAGIGGIGKTYLAAHFTEEINSTYKVFWLKCEEYLSVESLILEMGKYYAAFKKVEMAKDESKINLLINLLEIDKFALFLDGYEVVQDKSLERFIEKFGDFSKKAKIIITSKVKPSFFRDVSKSTILNLCEGLKENLSLEYLCEKNVNLKSEDRKVLQEVYKKCGKGIPLAMNVFSALREYYDTQELLYNLPLFNKAVAREWLNRLFEKLSGEEQTIVQAFSVFEGPVTRKAFKSVYDGNNKDNVDHLINTLIDKFILHLYSDGIYFANSLLRNYFYENLTNRKIYHKKAGQYYLNESIPTEDIKNKINAFYHFLKAEEYDIALSVIREIGKKLLHRGYIDICLNLSQKCLNDIPTNILKDIYFLLYELLGDSSMIKGNYLDAEKNFIRMIEFAKNGKEKGDTLTSLSIVYQRTGEYGKAIDYCKKALKSYDECNYSMNVGDARAHTLNILGETFRLKGECSEALQYLTLALDFVKGDHNSIQRGEILKNLGHVKNFLGNYVEAMKHFKDASNILSQNEQEVAYIENFMGESRLWAGDVDNALHFFEVALKKFREMQNVHGKLYAMNNKATVLRMKGQEEEALMMCCESLKGKIDTADRHGIADTLMNLGSFKKCSFARTDCKNYDSICTFLTEIKNKFGDLLNEDIKKQIENDQRQDLCILLIKIAISIFGSLDAKYYLTKALIECSRIYLRKNDQINFIETINKARNFADKFEYMGLMKDIDNLQYGK